MEKLLNTIKLPEDIKKLEINQLKQLADEIRQKIIEVTSLKGGHLAASLGAVELAVAVHYCMESPKDKIVWDVGHQSYAHKLLTGRLKQFDTLREMGGLSGFPKSDESEHDPFTCGHSSTSISAALGLAMARDLKNEDSTVTAIIGDASLSTGLAFEGMNHAGHTRKNLIVILNDNEHFISKPVGAMSRYLNRVITNPLYNRVKNEAERIVKGIPKLGPVAYKTVKKVQEGLKNLLVPGIIFEELGFRYFGPVDGHNLEELIAILKRVQTMKTPVFVHTITQKGKGYKFSEECPTKFHGIEAFDINTGDIIKEQTNEKCFTSYFSKKILELGSKNKNIVTITAAMPDGTGLQDFAAKFPDRFFDVGITEPHAVTFASGLAKAGLIPVVAVYSTFLQRAYDQLIHDVALQKLPVIFCIDRAGLVGKDGPTHHGVFDVSYTRSLPGFIVMAPKDGVELEEMLEKAVEWGKPVVIRYPRASGKRIVADSSCDPVTVGRAEVLREGKTAVILALGSMTNVALQAAEILSKKKIEVKVVNARFIKPLDNELLEQIALSGCKIFVIEECISAGGFGSAVLEFFQRENLTNVKVRCLGLPDEFIEHGEREQLLRKYHLTPDEIARTIECELTK
ncbi:MAG: 1-deoxy-D-xylulose-5-phosphate synthase [Candidatus Omnitrophota bacterium]